MTCRRISMVILLGMTLGLTGCAGLAHVKNNDIPTDQKPAHAMHRTPGK